jgi:hypothetical protein
MDETRIPDFLHPRLAEAEDKGIARPAILTLSDRSGPARAIFEELHGSPMPLTNSLSGSEFGPWEVLPAGEASSLLRRHAGWGGALVADLLSDRYWSEAGQPDFWFVGVYKESIEIQAFGGGEEAWHTAVGYDRSPRIDEDLSRRLWRLPRDRTDFIPAWGPSRENFLLAIALAEVASHQAIESRYQGKTVQIKLDDTMLASLLLDVYGDRPQAVAEALMALKRAGGGKELWLEQVLGSRQELRELDEKVRRELAGE